MHTKAPYSDELSLLVLSDSDSWASAVRSAAEKLGVSQIHSVLTAREVVQFLAGNEHRFSHLLLQSESAGGFLSEMIGLTAGEAGSGVALVVLGKLPLGALSSGRISAAEHMRVTFVPDVSHGWLERALFCPDAAAGDGAEVSEGELREALAEARIQARYQPIVRMGDRRPVGLEILARLEHPARGTLAPHLFVPRSEQLGLAAALAEAVMLRAMEDWGDGRLQALGLTLSMNLPLDVLLQPAVLSVLDKHRRQSGIPAESLIVELTESRPLSHLPELMAATTALRKWGYGLAIDDVGPNVRDHSALLDMPFDILKLDKGLVHEAPTCAFAQDFLLDTITGSHASGRTIVAEGVEDAEIWDRMEDLGVDQAQGFLVARPLPAAAVPIWHKQWCARNSEPR